MLKPRILLDLMSEKPLDIISSSKEYPGGMPIIPSCPKLTLETMQMPASDVGVCMWVPISGAHPENGAGPRF